MEEHQPLKTINIEFVGSDQVYAHKMIKVNGEEWNKFSGHIYYKRKISETYNSKADKLDEEILRAIKVIYPDARIVFDSVIIFKEQVRNMIFAHKGGTHIHYNILFVPKIDLDHAIANENKIYKARLLSLVFYLNLGPQSDKIENILKDVSLTISPSDLESITTMLESTI